jgi:signal transduction histidine kinase
VNYYAVSALINLTTNILIALLVLRNNRSSRQPIVFALFCGAVAFWSFFYVCWQMSTEVSYAILMCRCLMFGAIWIPVFFFDYTLALVDKTRSHRLLLIGSYALASVLSIADISTSTIVDHVIPRADFAFWPIPGSLFHVHCAMFAFLVLYAVILLAQGMRTHSGLKKVQLQYSLIATIVGFGSGITNYFLWYNLPVKPVATVSVSFYSVVIAFAILRHRFMDIRLILRDTTLHLLTASLLVAGCLVIGLPLVNFNPFVAVVACVIIMTMLMAFAYEPVHKALQPAIDRIMFANRFAYLEELGQLPNDLLEFTNLNEMLNFLKNRLKDAGHLQTVRVFMYDPAHQSYVETPAPAEAEAAEEIPSSSELSKLLKEDSHLLTIEEFRNFPGERGENLNNEMKALGGFACFPVMKEQDLLGIVVLGPKTSREPFNQQDLKILRALRLRLENFLTQAMTITQEALNMVKDSHDMKNDVNALKGRLSWRAMKLASWKIDFENQIGDLEQKLGSEKAGALASLKKQAVEWFSDAKRSWAIEEDAIRRLAHRLKNWAEYGRIVSEGFRGSRRQDAVDVVETVRLSVERWRPMAEKKAVQLSSKVTGKPFIWGERSLLEQIVENLIDNALKATSAGAIEVKCRAERRSVVIEVKDTGCGIPAEDLGTIFEKPFYQGKGRERLEQSTGVGLYLVAQYAKSLGGGIEAESQMEKGSIFRLTLPLHSREQTPAGAAA